MFILNIGELNAWGDAGRTQGKTDQTDEDAYAGVLELYTGYGWHWTTWTYKVHATSGNWGLYLLNSEANGDKVYPATDTEEQTREKWSACNSALSYTLNDTHANRLFHSELTDRRKAGAFCFGANPQATLPTDKVKSDNMPFCVEKVRGI